MTETTELRERYRAVKGRVAQAAARAGTSPDRVVIVAVTKYAEADQVRELIQLGHADFGENRVQQLLHRAALIGEWAQRTRTRGASDPGAAPLVAPAGLVRWHMIGRLQRNKVKKILGLCRLIHSLDSLRLAEEIQSAAARADAPADALLQVNVAREAGKGGCAVAAVAPLAEQIESMVGIRLRGLMTMAPYSERPEDSRRHFARCRELFDEMRDAGAGGPAFNILSMGMSADFEVAIEEGANMVRVGAAIFGQPQPGPAHGPDALESDDITNT